MNHIKEALAFVALVTSGAALAQESPVHIHADGLPSHVRHRLEEKAQHGPTALIQYVNRTRMMGPQVRVEDLVIPEDRATVAAARPAATRVAEARAAASK